MELFRLLTTKYAKVFLLFQAGGVFFSPGMIRYREIEQEIMFEWVNPNQQPFIPLDFYFFSGKNI
jgi:hypothetical protein